MKANELQLNDLVWLDYSGIQEVGKVTSLYDDGEFQVLGGSAYVDDAGKYCTPIPFTLEMFDANDLQLPETILEKNGDDPVDWNTLSFMYYRIDLEELQTEVWEVDIKHNQRSLLDGACTKIKFRYVHELQHALRLCGLNDLADNFKIE